MDVIQTITIQPEERHIMTETPNLKEDCLKPIGMEDMSPSGHSKHPPRILILYGSLREKKLFRLAAEEGARILERLGAEVSFSTLPDCRLLTMVSMPATRRWWNFVNS